MRLSRLNLPSPLLILAPMSGVTDLPFRKMVQQFPGTGLVFCEMLASWAMIRQARKTLKRGDLSDQGLQAMQLLGNDPDMMAQAARVAQDNGACLIDINMGCPAKKIAVNSYAGAALMQKEDLAKRIFEKVVNAVSIPVTVKMRMGWDSQSLNSLKLARVAQESGLSWVTLHGRTRCQLYTGRADWDFITHFRQNLTFPVIGNGDITTPQDAKERLEQSGVFGIMIGRGSYGKPWFLSQIHHFLTTGQTLPDPLLSEQSVYASQHFESLLDCYGVESGIKIARKHLGWYSKGLPGGTAFRQKICAQSCPKMILQQIKEFYDLASYT